MANDKLREALAGLIDGICFHCDLSGDCKGVPCEKMQNAKAALAEPVRNCEVGTAEEQARRFLKYCVKQDCEKACPFRDCKNSYECAFGWAQMPYEEGGAK